MMKLWIYEVQSKILNPDVEDHEQTSSQEHQKYEEHHKHH